MAEKTIIQSSFSTGEWAPNLNARVDLAKYQNAAALVRNFFVDYRGGLSSRMGTKWCMQGRNGDSIIRLIPFQASFTVGYVLEFGDKYIRFYYQGAPVLETAKTITGATKANPCVITSVGHGYGTGNDVYITGVGGMTQLNGRFFKINVLTANTFSLANLNGAVVDSSGYGTYTTGGTVSKVYELITSPYTAGDLALLKYAQNVNTMVLCHPSYPPYILTLNSAASWSIAAITFGSTVTAPSITGLNTTLAAGAVNYGYIATAIDINGQESNFNPPATLLAKQDLRTVAGSNEVVWGAITGAQSYNIYKTELSYVGAPPSGAQFGFIGNVTGVKLIDSNIPPDYSQTPPIANSPLSGTSVQSLTLTATGSYTGQPGVSIAPPGAGVTATATLAFQALSVASALPAGTGYVVGETLTLTSGIQIVVSSVAFGVITGFNVFSLGTQSSVLPANPVTQISTSGSGSGQRWTITWKVAAIYIVNPGSGYGGAPVVTISGGIGSGATATSTVGGSALGNPSVPGFFQQRLVLGSFTNAVQSLIFSQTGNYYNLDYHDPIQADDYIRASLVSGQLNEIKSLISMPSGLMVLSNKAAWQINGGSQGSAISPSSIVALPHAYNGASDVPPIVANYDILYVQSKGSIVRDLSYNFYANVFTGTDISVYSSHLFFGYQITGWTWAEEPFKIAWAVRNDGILLSLTFLKEQELVGWAHHDTGGTEGTFQSVASITEVVQQGAVDAVYFAVRRKINSAYVWYIERMADRFISDYKTAWCVDCGIQYNGVATTSFQGAEFLAGQTVTGLADGVPITPFVMANSGAFTLGSAASTVTVGVAYIPQLQTLPIETGSPTIQGKRKQIPTVTLRVADALGLSVGANEDTLVPMKDLVLGNLGSQTNEVVTGLVTGDAMTNINAQWTPQGQYFIQQDYPYPATVLGVIPDFTVGDTNANSRGGQ